MSTLEAFTNIPLVFLYNQYMVNYSLSLSPQVNIETKETGHISEGVEAVKCPQDHLKSSPQGPDSFVRQLSGSMKPRGGKPRGEELHTVPQ